MNIANQYLNLARTGINAYYELSKEFFKNSYTYKNYLMSVTSRKHKIKNKRKRKK